MFGITFAEQQPKDWRDLYQLCDWELYETIANHMVENGVMIEPDGFEPIFLCSDHTTADAAETLEVFEKGVKFALGKPQKAPAAR